VLIRVDPGTDVETTIAIVHYSGSGGSTTAGPARTTICAGAQTTVRVVELFVGPSGCTYFVNAASDITAGDGARVEHCRIQLEGDGAFHLSNQHSIQGRDSSLLLHNINVGGKTVRHDIQSRLDGRGADCFLNGLYLTRDSQHVDNQTILDHAQPHGSSRELYKGILDGNSRGIFSGRIVVREHAQKTDAKQSNRNLLLSRGALANTRPQLEIYADDVKCTHGATVGRLDEDAVFYLRSRGIADAAARRLMISAFAGEVLEKISQSALRDSLAEIVEARLRQRAQGEVCDG
jgi:Fe-S cluster assembly protein SufD